MRHDTIVVMSILPCKCSATIRTVIFAIQLLVAVAAGAANAGPQEPSSLGAYFGSLSQFQSGARVMVVYAEGDVSSMPLKTLHEQNINPVRYIHKTRHDQIERLLMRAKKLAAEHQAPAYALANLQFSTNVTSDAIIVETWGDLLGVIPAVQ
ncbi:MAG: hypothetical protein ABW153_11310 [Sedimenticola sp.]